MRTQALAFRSNRLPQKVAPRSAGAKSISPALKLIAFAFFLPEELSFYLFEFRLTLIRLVLFLLTPVLLVHFIQLLVSGRRHLVFSDILIVLTGAWMIISPAVVVDLTYSLHHSAPNAVEFCGSYLAGRVLLSERGQALSFVNLLCHVIAIVAFLGVLDILAGRSIIHDFLGPLTGYRHIGEANRLGLFRAMGPLDHPIIFGTVCGFGFLLAVASPIRAKGLTIAASGLGVLSSLSSGPIQGVIFGLGLLAYDRILPRFRGRWLLPIGIGALGIGALYAFGASPALVFCHLGLDCASYWIRVLEWNNSLPFVLNSPWVGIAFQWMETAGEAGRGNALGSIDSLWLFLALVYGIPGAVLVALSMVSAACYPASGRGVNLTMAESKIAVTLGVLIAVIVLVGFTVDFWEESWMLIGLLVGVRAHLADLGSQRAPSGSVFVRKSADGHHRRPLGGKRAADDNLLSRSPYAGAKDQP